jgi:hypothetical protein
MTDGNTTPAGWYPSEGGERYWDGNAWTDQTRPAQPPAGAPAPVPRQPVYQQQPVYPQQPPPQKSHVLRWVLLTVVLLFILFVGGCFALLSMAGNEVSKSIDETIASEAANDKPMAVDEGAEFEHDGYRIAQGWKVAPEQFGGTTIKGMTVTLDDDQGVSGGGRSALLTFRLYDGTTVAAEITCSSNQMQEGETSKMDCFGSGSGKVAKWDTIKVADAF